VEEGAAAEAARVTLLMSGRYAHGAAYVRGLVRGAGMEVREERATVVRKEAGEDVPGRLYVCGRQGGGEGGGENDNLNL
jgi:predicted TPR repeat methyltransferase